MKTQYLIRTVNEYTSVEEIGGLVLSAGGASQVRVRDVATLAHELGHSLVARRLGGRVFCVAVLVVRGVRGRSVCRFCCPVGGVLANGRIQLQFRLLLLQSATSRPFQRFLDNLSSSAAAPVHFYP